MKKKIVFLIIFFLFIMGIFYLQFYRKPTVCNVVTTHDCDGSDETITIIMNQIVILNKEETELTLINQILNNQFQNILFSHDVMGYPKTITVTVYANNWTKKLGIPAFHFRYAPNSDDF